MYKYNKTIIVGAEKLIDGIEMIEMFLDDDDDWNFHDSEIKSFLWNAQERTVIVSIEPIGYAPDIDGLEDGKIPLLDFHFLNVFEVHMDLYVDNFINEIEISNKRGYLQCWFNGYGINIISERLRVEPPRFVQDY